MGARNSITLANAFVPNVDLNISVYINTIAPDGQQLSGHGIGGQYATLQAWVDDINNRLPEIKATVVNGNKMQLENRVSQNLPTELSYHAVDQQVLLADPHDPPNDTLTLVSPVPDKTWGFCLSPAISQYVFEGELYLTRSAVIAPLDGEPLQPALVIVALRRALDNTVMTKTLAQWLSTYPDSFSEHDEGYLVSCRDADNNLLWNHIAIESDTPFSGSMMDA